MQWPHGIGSGLGYPKIHLFQASNPSSVQVAIPGEAPHQA